MTSLHRLCRHFIACCTVLALALSPQTTSAQDGKLIDFVRDVKPILDAKCLECHGPEDAKNDYRVDEEENMLGYVEAGDLENSSLWADYLVTDDEDLHMPPNGHPQLSGVELATIKLWIEEGATWGVAPEAAAEEAPPKEETEDLSEMSTIAKYWRFQGLFHPASVHFPIALLTVSAVCLLLSFFNRDSFEPVAFHCLWMGALGAVGACVMGWAYAPHEGYAGSSFNVGSGINRHRWLGIAMAVGALVLVPLGRRVRKQGKLTDRMIWLVCSFGLMLGVSITGYQGGELTYGEDHYAKEYELLFPSAEGAEETAPDNDKVAEATTDETSEDESSGDGAGANNYSESAAAEDQLPSDDGAASSTSDSKPAEIASDPDSSK
ncbi:MAG: DUF2231 domain-containing protein [Planctomycetota bacterium]|nr:DUF2231 domain-containing protein [Planctomycetota bacterium]